MTQNFLNLVKLNFMRRFCRQKLNFIKIFAGLSSVFFFYFCHFSPAQAEFVPLELETEAKKTNIILPFLNTPSLKGVGAYATTKFVKQLNARGKTGYKYEFVEVYFTNVTFTHFEIIKKYFGNLSYMKYDASRKTYNLMEFLPPKMQALYGNRFQSEDQIRSNCWGTAYELASIHSNNITLYYADPDQIFDVFRNTKYTKPVIYAKETYKELMEQNRIYQKVKNYRIKNFVSIEKAYEQNPSFDINFDTLPSEAKSYVANNPSISAPEKFDANIRFGDILLISQEGRLIPKDRNRKNGLRPELLPHTLVHAAIYIDGNVFFEKTALNDDAPYRLVTLETIKKTYGELYTHGTRFNFRRKTDLSDLPPAESVFVIPSTKSPVPHRSIGIKFREDGKAILAKNPLQVAVRQK